LTSSVAVTLDDQPRPTVHTTIQLQRSKMRYPALPIGAQKNTRRLIIRILMRQLL
jgi:hypothetical protein